MGFDLSDDYVDVAERVREFRTKHPEGSLQQLDLRFIEFGGKSWVVGTAAAYRSPEDPRPGMGTAWEPVPGRTPFTRDSELQNAETAAWGRALVAVLAAETKRIASADEVRARRDDEPAPQVTSRAEKAQKVADGLPGAVDLTKVEEVMQWATDRNLLSVLVGADGDKKPLSALIEQRLNDLQATPDTTPGDTP